jgi:hypothetical protein
MKTKTWRLAPVSVAIGTLLIAACGGGGGGETPVTNPNVTGTDVPLSATTSSAGALAFVRSVSTTIVENAEPLVVGDATLATSETDEPDPGV